MTVVIPRREARREARVDLPDPLVPAQNTVTLRRRSTRLQHSMENVGRWWLQVECATAGDRVAWCGQEKIMGAKLWASSECFSVQQSPTLPQHAPACNAQVCQAG
jgi:hypothetical protein